MQSITDLDRVAQQDSMNVTAWMQLGNELYRSGDHGRAVWAWARAGRLAPREPAVSKNLQAAGAVEVLRTRPPLSVRPDEYYLLAALLWWIAAAFFVVTIRRKHREFAWWGSAFTIIALILVLVGWNAANKKYAVAVDEDTVMYADPTVRSSPVQHVQAGAGLDILEDRSDWLRVRTLTQAEGWVEADAIGRL